MDLGSSSVLLEEYLKKAFAILFHMTRQGRILFQSCLGHLSKAVDLVLTHEKGYLPPVGFQYKGLSTSYSANALPITVPAAESEGIPEWPLLVADGPSCYDPQKGLRINRKEPFTAYLSRLQVHVQCTDSQLVING